MPRAAPLLPPSEPPFRGTNFLTVDAFLDKLEVVPAGYSFVYATGDLACSAQHQPDLQALRKIAWKMHERRRIALTQRVRTDRSFYSGGRAFDYIATKLEEKE